MRVHHLTSIQRILIVAALVIPILSGLAISIEPKKATPVTNPQTLRPNTNDLPKVEGSRTPGRRQQSERGTLDTSKPPLLPRTPPQPRETRVVAMPNPAQVGETVFFYLEPRALLSDSIYVFLFNYGDGSELARKDRSMRALRHQFTSPGAHSVSVTVESPAGVPPWQESIPPITVNVEQVKLAALPSSTEVGMPVSLKATSVSRSRRLQYRFSFGDNSQTSWQEANESAPHFYNAVGQYQPKVEIRFVDESGVVDSNNSDVVTVSSPPTESLVFRVDPSRVEPDQPVTFSAEFPAQGRRIQYRFLFDDNKTTQWQDEGQVTHSYAAGTYRPIVEVGVLLDRKVYPLASAGGQTIEVVTVERSKEVPPTVTETTGSSPVPTPTPIGPSWDWLVILILILVGLVLITAALVGGYKVGKSAFTPKPTFVAYTDVGTAAIVQSSAAQLVDFELQVNPNVAKGSYHVINSEPNLIRGERSQP